MENIRGFVLDRVLLQTVSKVEARVKVNVQNKVSCHVRLRGEDGVDIQVWNELEDQVLALSK